MIAGGLDEWISDLSCDDINNNLLCQYDGGDCCGVKVLKQYCFECHCKGIFCKTMTNNRKNNENWSFYFQFFLVQLMKTALDMAYVMNLEAANVFLIGITIQIAQVNLKVQIYR